MPDDPAGRGETKFADLKRKLGDKQFVQKLKKDIQFIFTHFSFLPAFILKLEREKVPLSEALPVIDHFQSLLKESIRNAPKNKKKDAEKIAAKFEHCLKDNVGLKRLRELIRMDPNSHWEYTQITSALTERLFGWYRRFFEEKSFSFSPVTLEQTTSCKLSLRQTFDAQRETKLQIFNADYEAETPTLRKLVDCLEGLESDCNIGAYAKKVIAAHQTRLAKAAQKKATVTRTRLRRK